jgi:hypothetical protein
LEEIKLDQSTELKESNKYLLSFINKEKIDISFNVNGRIRNALSNLNKEITIENYFSTKNDETQQYFVYFRVIDLNNDRYTIERVKNYIIENAKMVGVDLKYNFAYMVDGEINKDNLKSDIRDFFDIPEGQELPFSEIKSIMALATALYILSIVKDFTE